MIYYWVVAEPLLRWRDGLAKTSQKTFARLASVFHAPRLDQATWDELEEILIRADVGVPTAHKVLENLRRNVTGSGLRTGDQLREALQRDLIARLPSAPLPTWDAPTSVILVVGVNGSGKTTTIAKLVHYYKRLGKTTLLGAADTFRAAATEQLAAWAERLKVDLVAGAPESDPGAVAFNTVQSGMARGVDLVMIDTAGRLHTRSNLMEELKKVHRVVGKALPGAPHAVWLVLDATTGQNALVQARAFKESVGVTGVILAKLDASARGGMAFAVQEELGIPILFAGLGEDLDDLAAFQPEEFVAGVLR